MARLAKRPIDRSVQEDRAAIRQEENSGAYGPRASRHPTIRSSRVMELMADPERWEDVVRLALDGATPDELRELSLGEVWVRFAVATNPACPPDLLATLARDQSPIVRARAAANESTPVGAKQALLQDPDEVVIAALRDIPK